MDSKYKALVIVLGVIAVLSLSIRLVHGEAVNVIGSASLHIFGVEQLANGSIIGVPAVLNVTVTNGTGQVFLGSTPLTQVDTQAQAVISTDVACESLNLNCDHYNFYYFITSNSPEVGGPSAGGAFAIAAMSVLTGKPLISTVAMTGTANPDGSIGIVGDVSEKSEAAADMGIKVFLYPSSDNVSQSAVSYDEAQGMTLIPINSIYQAFQYFTGYNVSVVLNQSIYTPMYNSLMEKTYNLFDSYQNSLYSSIRSLNPNNSTIQSILRLYNSTYSTEVSDAKSGKYYVAASMAVESSVYLVEAETLDGLQNASNQSAYLQSLINNQTKSISSVYNYVANGHVTNSSNIDVKLIAIDRLAQASYALNQSETYLSEGDIPDAVYQYSLAVVKKVSSMYWESILPVGVSNFSQSSYENISQSYLYKASSYMQYTNLLGVNDPSEVGIMQQYFTKANNYFNEGQYVPSIFDSLEALATAQMLIEENSITNVSFPSVEGQMAYSALYAINNAEKIGVTPFLGISYYQFAQNFADSNQTGSEFYLIQYYSFSRVYADFEASLSNTSLPSVSLVRSPISLPVAKSSIEAALMFILGMAIGILVGGVMYEYRLYRILRKMKKQAGRRRRK
ncbi:MAG: S16 family serine protease [Candidatus Acidifodinimicrobium sp.]